MCNQHDLSRHQMLIIIRHYPGLSSNTRLCATFSLARGGNHAHSALEVNIEKKSKVMILSMFFTKMNYSCNDPS